MQTNTDSSFNGHVRSTNEGCRDNWLGKLAAFMFSMTALLWVVPANAGPVCYSNGANPPTNFPTSDLNVNLDQGQPQQMADDFILPAGCETITDVHWTGRYFPNPLVTTTDFFTIDICTDAAGQPGACTSLTFAPTTVSRTLNASNNYFDYWVDVQPIQVVGKHWISIYNDTADPNIQWLWGAQLGGIAYQTNSATIPASGPWDVVGRVMDFQLTGVPEPASLALVGLGLAGLGLARRRSAALHS